jgi:voltage-gated potassium channel
VQNTSESILIKNNLLENRVHVYTPFILLSLLFLIIFIVPFFPTPFYENLYNVLFTGIILFSAYVVEKRRRINLTMAILVIAVKWSILAYSRELRNISNVPQLLFFTYIVWSLVLQIARSTEEKDHVIIDCVNGYFLSALVCAILIGLTAHFSPGSFNFANRAETPIQGMNEYIYHALVVFSTTGFGDIIPITPIAKSVSTFISVVGQLYVAIIIALLIGHHSSKFRI